VLVDGKDVANRPPIASIRQGMSHVPEDRTGVGSAPNLSITDNTIMKSYRIEPIGSRFRIDLNRARTEARTLKEKYQILAPSVRTLARKLSGGNLQKVILAREISANPAVMVAVQPTRGLDVGAIEAVQQLLLAQRAAGTGILLISEELEELLALSDRIAVIYGGRIMGVVDAAEADIQELGLMMTGTSLEALREREPATRVEEVEKV
jgi:simple sugar transport system ATP-binding protein